MASHFRSLVSAVALGAVGVLSISASAQTDQQEHHGRKWKPLPETAHMVVTVEKAFNGKPLANAGVVFRETRNGHNEGSLEVKTDPEGRATIDVLEIGSHVTVQVIASGFATAATELDLDAPNKELLIKMQRPRAQISEFQDNSGKPSQEKPGVQEHVVHKPAPAPAAGEQGK